MSAWKSMAAVALAAAATSCELSPRLYLSVRTEAGSQVRDVRVRVYAPPTAAEPLPDGTIQRTLEPGRRVDLRVVARVGGERVRVLVEGYALREDRLRVRQEWIASLPTEGAGYLQVVLWNSCFDRPEPCPDGRTCASDGSCVPQDVGAAPVSIVDGGALGERADGGAAGDDAATDVPALDAQTDAPPVPVDRAVADAGVPLDRVDSAVTDTATDLGPPIDRVDAGTDAVTGDGPLDAGRCPGPSTTARTGWTNCGSVWCPTGCDGRSACAHVVTLGLGRSHGCALRSDRGVVCFGNGGVGAVGNGTSDAGVVTVPTPVLRQGFGTLFGMQSLFTGFDANCGVDDIGEMVCWGAGGGDLTGQEHEPSYAARPAAPYRRADAGVEENRLYLAAISVERSCMVPRRGSVRCRSRTYYLPDGGEEYYALPSMWPVREVPREGGGALDDVTSIGMGFSHACVTRGDRSVWCWGTNRSGQLALPLYGTTGGVAYSETARRVAGLGPVTSLGVGDFFTCALSGAEVRCWGLAGYGRVGTVDGVVDCSSMNLCAITPVPVRGMADLARFQQSSPVQVTAGAEHACVRLANGGVWCWGLNGNGELGLPSTGTGAVTDRAGVEGSPVFTGADEVIAGGSGGGANESWTCAHRADDCTWWCWGRVPGEVTPPADPWRPRVLRWGP